MSWWRLKLILWLWPTRPSVVWMCSNRIGRSVQCRHYEVVLTMRDTRREDGYSRTELLEMLQTIRKHERVQGWRVPEEDESMVITAETEGRR